jgi:hypothetical protein
VTRGGPQRPHLVDDDPDAERGGLPGRFRAGQAPAEDVDHPMILRFGGLPAGAT